MAKSKTMAQALGNRKINGDKDVLSAPTPSWLKEVQSARRADLTTVLVIETRDVGRFREAVEWASNPCVACGHATEPLVVLNENGTPRLVAECQAKKECGKLQNGHLIYPDYADVPEAIVDPETKEKRDVKVTKTFPEHLLLLTPFRGLREVKGDDADHIIGEVPVKGGSDEDELMASAGPIQIGDRNLRQLFKLVSAEGVKDAEAKLRKHRNLVCVRWDYTRENELNGAGGHLSDFIVDVSVDDDVLNGTKSTILVFVPDRSMLTPQAMNSCSLIVPPVSTHAERVHLIQKNLARYNRSMVAEKYDPIEVADKEIEQVAHLLGGLNLEQTQMAVVESLKEFSALEVQFLSKRKADIVSKSGDVKLQERPNITFDHVGGYVYLKNALNRRVVRPAQYPEVRAMYNGAYKGSRGVLLVGPPGTGKSLIAKALANALGYSYVELQADAFKAPLVGESERKLREALNVMQAAEPLVWFSDEIESLMPNRDNVMSTDSGVSRNLESMMLAWLDDPSRDRQTVLVAATNRPKDMDPAMLRPGRLDDIFYVGYPDQEARADIFRVHLELKNRPPIAKDIDYKALAAMTPYWSGAEIEATVRGAIQRAADEAVEGGAKMVVPVAQKHLLAAASMRTVNAADRKKQEQRFIQDIEGLVSDKEHLEAYQGQSTGAASGKSMGDVGAGAARSQRVEEDATPADVKPAGYLSKLGKKGAAGDKPDVRPEE